MDLKNTWTKSSSSSGNELHKKLPPDRQQQPFSSNFNSQQKWEDPSLIDYGLTIEKQISRLNNQIKIPGQEDSHVWDTSKIQGWDPRVMLSNLSFMEQKIHQLKDLVHLIVGRRAESVDRSNDLIVAQQQQLITADLTSIIVQLISTAGSLLPAVKHTHPSLNPSGGDIFSSGVNNNIMVNKVEDQSNEIDLTTGNCGTEQIYIVEEHESKDEEDGDEGENLPPGSYEILQLEKEEILAPHTHFCMICGKGFKRDANLRMHMRGHGDEYKTAAALAKPQNKESSSSEPRLIKRYSCPYVGCKRNRDHKKFQPLKTILCVKNHYKRTHCDKSYTCSRCHSKKFSVIADLKTHEKHCGRDKWLCSCGTTFSRKDKLFGHIALFQGHTPAIPLDEAKGSVGLTDHGDNAEAPNKVARLDFNFGTNSSTGLGVQNDMDVKGGGVVDPTAYFSPLNFDTCNLSGLHECPRSLFEDSESSFSFLISESCGNFPWKNGGESGSNNLQ